MSKPKALEWNLVKWTIEYRKGAFDVGIDGPDPVSWRATIVWGLEDELDFPEETQHEDLRSFQEAVAWVEKEAGLAKRLAQ